MINKEILNKINYDHLGKPYGIFAIKKPVGITSHGIVDQVRRILSTRKVGHVGALDPFAEGILLILVGKETKKSEMLMKKDKSYFARIILGITTDSGDIDGKIVNEDRKYKFDQGELLSVIKKFNNNYNQYVPVFSSVKVNGMKLRELARNSISFTIEETEPKSVQCVLKENARNKFYRNSMDGLVKVLLPSRDVRVKLTIIGNGISKIDNMIDPLFDHSKKYHYIDLNIDCSKGTYIRQLAQDIGVALGTVGMLVSLERTKVANITLEDAITIEELAGKVNKN